MFSSFEGCPSSQQNHGCSDTGTQRGHQDVLEPLSTWEYCHSQYTHNSHEVANSGVLFCDSVCLKATIKSAKSSIFQTGRFRFTLPMLLSVVCQPCQTCQYNSIKISRASHFNMVKMTGMVNPIFAHILLTMKGFLDGGGVGCALTAAAWSLVASIGASLSRS